MPQHIKDLNIENVSLSKTGRVYRLTDNKNEKEFLSFTTNTMYTPFGINTNQNKYNPNLEYSISASINASDTEFAVETRNSLELLDKKIQELVTKQKDDLKLEHDFAYTSFYKNSGNYPKLIKFNFTRDTHGNFKTILFNSNKEKIPLNETNIAEIFKKGSLFRAVTNNKKVWVYNGRVGTIWDLDQILLVDKSNCDNDINSVEIEETEPNKIEECIMLDD
jgi:hypothetical protein